MFRIVYKNWNTCVGGLESYIGYTQKNVFPCCREDMFFILKSQHSLLFLHIHYSEMLKPVGLVLTCRQRELFLSIKGSAMCNYEHQVSVRKTTSSVQSWREENFWKCGWVGSRLKLRWWQMHCLQGKREQLSCLYSSCDGEMVGCL